ncbi:MAG: ribonuclease III [Rhizobiales bacterium 65-79]|jgi:ribonuclease-3|nr:ribonuclease III [Hyphomicrobiales bacterium]OJU05245.1 MAG: ribonuclease III [Rhizobiales bacterium 65-79]
MERTHLSGKELAHSLEQRIGHAFRDERLLQRALTHASARGGRGADYQRLEFLGDRVLGLVIAQMLFQEYGTADEGELSLRLNALVNAETLAEISEEIGLMDLVRTGSDIKTLSGRKRVNLRADVMEALIAALYLDGGFETARDFVLRHWAPRSKGAGAARRDPKTELQEWAHQVSGAAPIYSVESREGPDHDPVFTVRAAVDGFAPAEGSGRSKREAEQAAATAMLLREKVRQGAGTSG